MIKTLMIGLVVLIFSGCSDPQVDSEASNRENVIAAAERVLYTEHYFPALNKKPLREAKSINLELGGVGGDGWMYSCNELSGTISLQSPKMSSLDIAKAVVKKSTIWSKETGWEAIINDDNSILYMKQNVSCKAVK